MENSREYRVGETVSLNAWALGKGQGFCGDSGVITLITTETSPYSGDEIKLYHVNTGKRIMPWSADEVN